MDSHIFILIAEAIQCCKTPLQQRPGKDTNIIPVNLWRIKAEKRVSEESSEARIAGAAGEMAGAGVVRRNHWEVIAQYVEHMDDDVIMAVTKL